jgi:stage III sporulation protein AF
MIEWISNWAGSIIVAVVIGTIIEMILPEGNSKKYIKMVIGVYILFTIVSPVINSFTGNKIKLSDELDLDTYIEESKDNINTHNTFESNNEKNIMDIYISGLEDDLKAKLKSKGYIVNSINIDVSDNESYTIDSIDLILEKDKKEDNNEVTNDDNKNSDDTSKDVNINSVDKVDKVNIDLNNKNSNSDSNNEIKENKNNELIFKLSNVEIRNLKEYISDTYEVNKNNITIN